MTTMLLIYDEITKLPKYTVEEPYPENSKEFYTNLGEKWIEIENQPIHNKMIVENPSGVITLETRPEFPGIWDKKIINPSIQEVATLRSSLKKFDILIDNQLVETVEDGVFEFVSQTTGTYKIIARCEPYLDNETIIRATLI